MSVDVRQTLRAAIAVERSVLASALMTLGSIVIPLLLRLAIDGGRSGVQFAFIYPAALAIAILCRWRWAVLSGLGGIVATRHFLMGSGQFGVNDWQSGTIVAVVTISLAAIIQVGTVLRSTVRQLDASETQVATLNGELLHRSRNALQIIQALASGAKVSQDPVAFYRSLEGRLKAMADANLLLQYGAAHGCTLQEVISVALKPFDCDRITFDGATGQIESGSVVPLALALHELATNATKYGALSNDAGRVSITCTTESQKGLTETVIIWAESGGPSVSPPLRRGMGTRLLSSQRALKIVRLDFDPDGVICEIRVKVLT